MQGLRWSFFVLFRKSLAGLVETVEKGALLVACRVFWGLRWPGFVLPTKRGGESGGPGCLGEKRGYWGIFCFCSGRCTVMWMLSWVFCFWLVCFSPAQRKVQPIVQRTRMMGKRRRMSERLRMCVHREERICAAEGYCVYEF
jgi:hypothetical protein